MKTSLWHNLTPNSYLKTNSLAGKNSLSFLHCLIYQLNHDLRTSQNFSRGETHQHFVLLSLHCKFLKDFILIFSLYIFQSSLFQHFRFQ